MDAKKTLDNIKPVDRGILHPEAARQNQVKELLSPSQIDMMTDLTMDEIRTIALYRALNVSLDGELTGIMALLDDYIKLKLSYDRLSRKELVSILRPAAKYYVSGSSTHDPENRPELAEPQQKRKKRFGVF